MKYFSKKAMVILFGFYEILYWKKQSWKNYDQNNILFGFISVIVVIFTLYCGKLCKIGSCKSAKSCLN